MTMSSEWQDPRCRSHPHCLAEALGSVSLSGSSGQMWELGKQPLETSAISIKGFILHAALGPENSQLDPADLGTEGSSPAREYHPRAGGDVRRFREGVNHSLTIGLQIRCQLRDSRTVPRVPDHSAHVGPTQFCLMSRWVQKSTF